MLDLLSSPVPLILAAFDTDIAVASEGERFEEAQRLRNQREQLLRLHAEQQALIAYDSSAPYLILQNAPQSTDLQILVIVRGRWWSQIIESPDDADRIASRLAVVWKRYHETGLDTIDHESVDEAAIIGRWRALPAAQQFVVPFDPERAEWRAVAEQVIASWQRLRSGADPDRVMRSDEVVACNDTISSTMPRPAPSSDGSLSLA